MAEITREQRIKFLREEYDKADRDYQRLCDERGEMAESLARKRAECDAQLKFMHSVGEELLELLR